MWVDEIFIERKRIYKFGQSQKMYKIQKCKKTMIS